MHEGDTMAPVQVTPDRWLTVRYAAASGDYNPVHVDDEIARAAGLPGRILHGLWTMAITAGAAAATVGGDPRQLAEMSVQFRGIGVPEEIIEVTGTVTRADDREVVLDVEALQGQRTLIGNATARLRRTA